MLKMKMKHQKSFALAGVMLALFAVWTLLVRLIDVQPIGPCASSVGFVRFNGFVHELTGTNMTLYTLTDWLGLVPFAVAAGFGILGLVQWIKRKKFLAVDGSILALGGFYVAVIAFYVFFEYAVVNYRPVLINGILEVSYPSSTTMLVMSVMPTAMMQLHHRIHCTWLRRGVALVTVAFIAFMVIGRLLSGVHWVTDILGGAMLSTALVMAYVGAVQRLSLSHDQTDF